MYLIIVLFNLFFITFLSANEEPPSKVSHYNDSEIIAYLHELLGYDSNSNVQNVLEEYLGASFLTLAGYCDHPLETGVVGFGEAEKEVRVTFINGILNQHANCLETAKMISNFHGGVNIHYVYRPTTGWANDLIGAVPIRFGFAAPQSVLLAKMWKELIDEMGGIDSGGIIIHYGHSIGASDTWNAMSLLSDEEKKVIKVITFGSPVVIKEDGFHSITNYVSVRDGVPLLDPFGYFKAHYNEVSEVIFVGSIFDGFPIIDHPLTSYTYHRVLTELGEDFIASFGRVHHE